MDEDKALDMITELIGSHEGSTPVKIYLNDGRAVRPAGARGADTGSGFTGLAAEMFGEENVKEV